MKYLKSRNGLLIGILFAGLLVRLIGTKPGFWPYHPDEPMSYSSAREMILNNDLNPRRFDYPAGVPYLHLLVFRTVFVPIKLVKFTIEDPGSLFDALKEFEYFPKNIQEELFGYRSREALFWSRHITAVLGMICVWIVYLVGKKLADPATGLVSAFFLAFNFRHVLSSHFAVSDIPNSLFILIAFLAAVNLAKENSKHNYILAGGAVGLAFAIKFQVFAVFPLAVAHLYWVYKMRDIKLLVAKEILISGVIAALVFIVLNPYLPFHLKPVPMNRRVDSFITANQYTAKRYAFGSNTFNHYAYFYLFKWGVGKGVSLSIIAGTFLMLFARRLAIVFIVSIVVPFLFVFTYYGGAGAGYYVRNYSTIVPFMLLPAGFIFSRTFYALKNRLGFSKWIAGMLITSIIIIVSRGQIKSSVKLSYNYTKPWTYERTADWVVETIPKNAELVESSGVVTGILREKGFENIEKWPGAEFSVVSISELQEEGVDFAVIATNQIRSVMYGWTNNTDLSEMIEFDGPPYPKMNNTYFGLVTKEMLSNLVYESYLPLVTPTYNNFVVKIPLNPILTGSKLLNTNSFNKEEMNWKIAGGFGSEVKGLTWEKEIGTDGTGGLKIYNSSPTTARFVSPPFKITEGNTYLINGVIKNSKKTTKEERSAFLRMDFYESDPSSVEEAGAAVAISSRVFGDGGWSEATVFAKAPPKSRYLTVSFQKYRGEKYTSILDFIEIYETEPAVEQHPEIPYIDPSIEIKYIYPKAIL